MKLEFITKNDFRAEDIYTEFTKAYVYYIEVIKGNIAIQRTEVKKLGMQDLISVYDPKMQYIIPQLTGYYGKLLLPDDLYFSVYFWLDKNTAYLIHTNTSWSDTPYYKQYTIDIEIKNQQKVPRNKNILQELLNSKKVVMESKDYIQEFDNFNEYLYKMLDTIYTNQKELEAKLKDNKSD